MNIIFEDKERGDAILLTPEKIVCGMVDAFKETVEELNPIMKVQVERHLDAIKKLSICSSRFVIWDPKSVEAARNTSLKEILNSKGWNKYLETGCTTFLDLADYHYKRVGHDETWDFGLEGISEENIKKINAMFSQLGVMFGLVYVKR